MITLMPGSRLGPYEIAGPLGAGGMGEVYRARDTRLGRYVVIKVLPPHLTRSREARTRFEREARAISQLNHPNICTLYDNGREAETDYLVMELVTGGNLRDRLAKKVLPLEQVLDLGIEIADALETAHARGIVHWHLHPENVLLTERGQAKVTDFGLAVPEATPYISPEQARGEEVDARSDVFSLGAVLYEMASGHRAFEGSSPAEISEAIQHRTPAPASALRPGVPEELDRILGKALEKDPELRYQTAAEVRSDLRRLRRDQTPGWQSAGASWRRWLMRSAARVAAVLAAGVAVIFALQLARREPAPRAVRLTIEAPPGVAIMEAPIISPDGRLLAYCAWDTIGVTGPGPHRQSIWIRPIGGTVAWPLPGTEGGGRPFWSPDSRSLGFISEGRLKTVAMSGGEPVTISDAADGDGSWGVSRTILLDGAGDHLVAVSATGGEPARATWLDSSRGETDHAWPHFLPDGRHFLYLASIRGRRDSTAIRVGVLGSRESRILTIGSFSQVVYAAPGFLLFERGRTLFAQPFDANGLRLMGDPFPVVDDAMTPFSHGSAYFSASATGVLVYQSELAFGKSRLVWRDRSGSEIGTLGPAAMYWEGFALSPDQQRAAAAIVTPGESSEDIWVYDVARNMMTRLTSDPHPDKWPVWSADGGTIFYRNDRTDQFRVYQKAASGLGTERELAMPPGSAFPTDVSRDGRYLLVNWWPAGGSPAPDIAMVSLDGSAKTTPLLASDYMEMHASISPDGTWLAYTSNETGREEVYVTSFPGLAARWRVSASGGRVPQWSADGTQLFFLAPEQGGVGLALMSAAVATSPEFRVLAPPERLFATGYGALFYAPSSDGRKFLVLVPAPGEKLPPTNVILNWTSLAGRG